MYNSAMKLNQKGFLDHTVIIAILLVLTVAGFVAYQIYSGNNESSSTSSEEIKNTTVPETQANFDDTNDAITEEVYPAELVTLLDTQTNQTKESCANVENPELYDEAGYKIDEVIDGKYASVTGYGCNEASGQSSLYVLDGAEWVLIPSRVGPLCTDLEMYEFPSSIVFNESVLDSCRNESLEFVSYPRI